MISFGGLGDPTRILGGGAEIVGAGGTDKGAQISGGEQEVFGFASGAAIKSAGTQVLEGGGTASATTVSSGGIIELIGDASASFTLRAGASVGLGSGYVLSAFKVSNGVVATILSGGTLSSGTVLSGGTAILELGGVVSGGVFVSKGGTFEFVGVNADIAGALVTVSPGATFELGAGAYYSGRAVSSGSALKVLSGGTDYGSTTVLSGALLDVLAGGLASAVIISRGGIETALSRGVDISASVMSGGTEIVSSGGVASGTVVESGGKLLVLSGGTAVDPTVENGGTAINSKGGSLDAVTGATDSGRLVNSGAVNVTQGGTLTLAAATISNVGALNLSGDGPATLLIEGAVILAGGGTVALAGDGDNVISGSSTATLINAGNTMSGAGDILGLNFVNSGTVNADDPQHVLFVGGAGISNAGVLEDTAAGGLFFQGTPTISNSTKGIILASGVSATVTLVGVAVDGGSLKTSAAGDIAFVSAGNILSGATIATSSLIEVNNAGALRVSGGTIGAGATLETLGDGSVIVTGTVTNGGTLFANGSGSLIEIASGAVVSGGGAEVGDGIVAILGSSSENVSFLSTGNGGLAIADTSGHATAFKGRVSGFGGIAHANHIQFIDLVSVTSAPNTISTSYLSANAANTSGTLFVSSGGVQVAAITMVGHYSAGNFVLTAGSGGTVEITDPAVPNGGSVTPGSTAAFPQHGIDLPNIAFGAQTTLAYSESAAGTGGTLTVDDGRHAARDRASRQLHRRKLYHRRRRSWRHAGHGRANWPTAVADTSAASLTGGLRLRRGPGHSLD